LSSLSDGIGKLDEIIRCQSKLHYLIAPMCSNPEPVSKLLVFDEPHGHAMKRSNHKL